MRFITTPLGVTLLLAAACGGAPRADPLRLREVVLYQNGVAYFDRDGRVEGRELRLDVRAHELDDVLTTLTIVDPSSDPSSDGAGTPSAPSAVVPRGETDADDVHTLAIDLGAPRREVRVGYATQTSAWRASYRMVLPDGRGEGEALLQGWAVVDNTTAEDWHGVSLTLATAAPLSFAVDLRTPRVVDRPNVTGHVAPPVAVGPVYAERASAVDRDADGIPDVDDACPDEGEQYNGVEDGDGCPDRARVVVQESRIVIRDGEVPPGGDGGPDETATSPPASRAPTHADGLARAFDGVPLPRAGASGTRYAVAGEVSVPAGESAMVAMLDAHVRGEDVLLFREDPGMPGSAEHPFRAARLENDSDVDLVPGPMSLFSGGELLGQGLIDGLRVGQNAFVPYALDEGTHVRRRVEREHLPSRLVALADGRVTLEQIAVERTVFEVAPGRRVPERIYFRVPRPAGWDPHDPPPGTETGPDAVLVPAALDRLRGHDAAPFVVELRTTRRVTIDLVEDLAITLEPYVEGGVPVSADLERLRSLLADRADLSDLHRRVELLHVRLRENADRATELRRAVESLAETGPETARVRRRIAGRLDEAVADGERLAAELSALRARQAEARHELRRAARDFVVGE